jgi:hypothetical protein
VKPKLTSRLSKLIPRLASDNGPEVIATVRAIETALRAEGFDLHDLAAALQDREIVVSAKAPQIASAPTWEHLLHQERRAWMDAIKLHPETTDFQREYLSKMANSLRVGMVFAPHWRHRKLFDERVARIFARGGRP